MKNDDNKEIKRKHLKLLNAYQNDLKISDKNLKDKFEKFEDSVLHESMILLYETDNNFKFFKRFSRGSIVRVKFGINIGSELSGEHFAKLVICD